MNKLKKIVSEEVLRDTDESVKLLRTFEKEKRTYYGISSQADGTRLDQIKNLSKELETVIKKLSSSLDSYPMIKSSLVYLFNFSNNFDKPALTRALENNAALADTPASTDVSESSTASGGSGAGTGTGTGTGNHTTSSRVIAPIHCPAPTTVSPAYAGTGTGTGTGTAAFAPQNPTTPFLVTQQLGSPSSKRILIMRD